MVMWNFNLKPIGNFVNKVKEWDKKKSKWFQDKFKLTDYQMLCISFAKGFIIGAILL